MSSSVSAFRSVSYNSESKQVLHDPGPVWGVSGRKDQIELGSHLVLMKDDGSLGIYARRKYKRHHGRPRF
jgi:hypothetical protein